jgi:hypothetical protein
MILTFRKILLAGLMLCLSIENSTKGARSTKRNDDTVCIDLAETGLALIMQTAVWYLRTLKAYSPKGWVFEIRSILL